MPINVASICRYPVKGLSHESMDRVRLTPGECLPQDRRFAIAHAATRFDPERPEWLLKTNFVMLMRDEKLAQLRTHFDEQSGLFTIEHEGRLLLSASITEPAGRLQIDAFLAEFLKDSLKDPPRIVEAPGHTFSDAKRKPNSTTYKYVSLVNLASVRALEEVVQVPVDPIRFRANLYHEGAPAWAEHDWVGSEIMVGSTRLHVVSPTERCAATNVNPATAKRDMKIPRTLQEKFGHIHMGVYAEVVAGGVGLHARRAIWRPRNSNPQRHGRSRSGRLGNRRGSEHSRLPRHSFRGATDRDPRQALRHSLRQVL